jgi:hypothetical protein
MKSSERSFTFQLLGLRVKIWKAEQDLSTALSTALSIEPEIDT